MISIKKNHFFSSFWTQKLYPLTRVETSQQGKHTLQLKGARRTMANIRKGLCKGITKIESQLRDERTWKFNHQTFQVPKMQVLTYTSFM